MQVHGKATCLATAIVLTASLAGAQTLNGPIFSVETYTTGPQGAVDVAVDSGGHFIVTWAGQSPDDDLGIRARRYSSSGVPLGPEFRVNTFTTDEQMAPAVAVAPNGRFVVVWHSYGADGDLYGVMGQLFDPVGTPIGGEFQINTYTFGYQYLPDVAAQSDGTFVVAWQSDDQDGEYYGIVARRLDNNGAPIGGEFVVNNYTTGYQYQPRVMANSLGFAIAWDGQGGGDNAGIFARLYLPNGTPFPVVPLNNQFRVNTVTANSQRYVSLAAGGPNFVVAWEDVSDSLPTERDVFARRFAGTVGGVQFRVNTYTTDYQVRPNVAMDSTGAFVVAWSSYGPGAYDVMARNFDAAGAAVQANEFLVNSYTTGYQRFPAAAAGGPGDFIVAWEGQETDVLGVYAQRYGDLIFSDNVESGLTAFWPIVTAGIAATGGSALEGNFGLEATVAGNAGVFVEDSAPENENRYRARFYIDPNTHDPGETLNQRRVRVFVLFEDAPNRRLASVVLRRLAGQFALAARARVDDNSQIDTAFTNITDAPHFVEVDWQRSSSPSANDGFFLMQIDGVAVTGLTNLDNNLSSVDTVRLGTISNKSGAAGVVFVDEFVSRRTNPIGPVN